MYLSQNLQLRLKKSLKIRITKKQPTFTNLVLHIFITNLHCPYFSKKTRTHFLRNFLKKSVKNTCFFVKNKRFFGPKKCPKSGFYGFCRKQGVLGDFLVKNKASSCIIKHSPFQGLFWPKNGHFRYIYVHVTKIGVREQKIDPQKTSRGQFFDEKMTKNAKKHEKIAFFQLFSGPADLQVAHFTSILTFFTS